MGLQCGIAKRNYFLDVLKGICIIFVIITHYKWQAAERLQYGFPFWVDMAVPIFMIISGYVYACSFRKNEIENIEKAYELKFIVSKLIRYTVPFAVAYSLEIMVDIIFGEGAELT